MQPLIGISGRLIKDTDWCPPIVGHRQGYVNGVLDAGGVPVLLPPLTDLVALRALFERMDGILLAGGEDVAPEIYNEQQHPQLGSVSTERDAAELMLARWAVEEGKPLLGICRGIQVLNVALGGTLWQDLLAQCPGVQDHQSGEKAQCWDTFDHTLQLDTDSLLATLLHTTALGVNSLHHQAVNQVGQGLRVVGRAPDGVVEAVEGTGDGFVVAVQCHPEQLWQGPDPRWRNVFRAFVEACVTAPVPC
jgi:putative glutamine amidotransferase